MKIFYVHLFNSTCIRYVQTDQFNFLFNEFTFKKSKKLNSNINIHKMYCSFF